ncbi:hypothetical protein SporoP37_00595 [Sporosarcina sp. P37]|uniref:competence type IV pilus minor pilin ComGF n=1 Tax=unclassified Sporosarcina TaxID=2647733 RepID=UPI0009C3D90E|nr:MULTISPECIES: competence type IV pilus minor pilin ComGF [unclassified Sporosarcina]ARD46808.1 hypothetical protein SporoP33_00185 [Sporosarcina sp. P33]ARK23335.1 hypothetical protein SporoP37_00595 [Sporosarcina sp. P37]
MKGLNDKGFSLVESIIHLLIFSVIIQMTVLFFYWQAPVEKVYQEELLGEWELFSLELQELLKEVESITEPTKTSFAFRTERGRITIQHYDKMLRKLVDGAGHVPLLMNVKNCNFTVLDDQLHIVVVMLNGVRKERTFAIGKNSE